MISGACSWTGPTRISAGCMKCNGTSLIVHVHMGVCVLSVFYATERYGHGVCAFASTAPRDCGVFSKWERSPETDTHNHIQEWGEIRKVESVNSTSNYRDVTIYNLCLYMCLCVYISVCVWEWIYSFYRLTMQFPIWLRPSKTWQHVSEPLDWLHAHQPHYGHM